MQIAHSAVRSLKRRFWIAVALTALSLLLMRFLTDGLAASDIVEFEMAKTTEKAKALMELWGTEGTSRFIRGIYADFIFIGCYCATLFFGCRYTGHLSGHSIFKNAGYIFSYLALIAGICDILENASMLFTINKQVVAWVVHFAYDMAFVKFSLIFITLLFMVICLFFWGIDKLGKKSSQ